MRTQRKLPIVIASVDRSNLLSALDSVRGCLKTTSMLWMHALEIPVLSGVVISDWSATSAEVVHRFCEKHRVSELLLRIDKRNDRWTRRRGGYLVRLSEVPATVKELKREGRIAVLLEPASPYADAYSVAGITDPVQRNMTVEVVGPGFDASDILRGDIQAHERWELPLKEVSSQRRPGTLKHAECVHLTTSRQYEESVRARLAKIGARIRNPAFPDAVLQAGDVDAAHLREAATSYLRTTHQTALLRNAKAYSPIPQKHLMLFARHVESLLSGLAAYGIHLGPTSFAASVLAKRGLIFWDFFPASKSDAASLYPAAVGQSYREAKGGPFDFFHHKRPVSAITDDPTHNKE